MIQLNGDKRQQTYKKTTKTKMIAQVYATFYSTNILTNQI